MTAGFLVSDPLNDENQRKSYVRKTSRTMACRLQEGELFCNQRYGDWPKKIEQGVIDPWENPEWMLLSCGKPAKAFSFKEGNDASKATGEDVQTWWKAASNESGQYLEIDLLDDCDEHAVQINFADDQLNLQLPEGAELHKIGHMPRIIDHRKHFTRWLLEVFLANQNKKS